MFRKEYREFLGEEDIINLSIFLDKRYVTIRKIIDWSFLWYAFNSCLKADAYRGLKLVVSLRKICLIWSQIRHLQPMIIEK